MFSTVAADKFVYVCRTSGTVAIPLLCIKFNNYNDAVFKSETVMPFDNACPLLVYGLVEILVSISLAMFPRPRAGDLRASIRADQKGGGSVWVNQCSSMPVKQASAT